MTRHPLLLAGVLVGCLGCAGSARLPPAVEGQAPPSTEVVTPAAPKCSEAENALDATRSYATDGPLPAPGEFAAGSTMQQIRDRGHLIVGVSADTLLFGARNPLTNELEGFDIDILKEVAQAIFGPDTPGVESPITYKVITYADRLPMLEAGPDNGGVDIVAHTMTINCNRWLRIAFSSEYYHAGQKVLVKKGSGFDGIDALNAASASICAPEGSTNIDLLRNGEDRFAKLKVIAKPDITDCLVAMQQGEADAATGDDTVLAGLAKQDSSTEVVPEGAPFTDEPYGLGIAKDRVDFVRFVNVVLEQLRSNGRWAEIYNDWLFEVLKAQNPPPAVYGRDES
jgi:polar amino acid transport system substrate-binding protein